MNKIDVDRERSEEVRSINEFLRLYNENLPDSFPKATKALLVEFKKTHLESFKGTDNWSLDVHRKKVMDWLPSRVVKTEA